MVRSAMFAIESRADRRHASQRRCSSVSPSELIEQKLEERGLVAEAQHSSKTADQQPSPTAGTQAPAARPTLVPLDARRAVT